MNERRFAGLYFFLMAIILLPAFFAKFGYVFEYVDLSPWDYQKLISVDATYELLDDEDHRGGKVLVTEQVTFDVHQANRGDLCYELWLDLPEQDIDGLRQDYKILSVAEIKDDGTRVEYDECSDYWWDNYEVDELSGTWYHSDGPYSKTMDQYEAVFFYVDGIYRDQITFEVTYLVNNAVFKYKDCSDLYLLLYSESPIKDLESYEAQILIPDKDMPSAGNYEYYTYGSDNNGFDVVKSSSKNPGYTTFDISMSGKELEFKPYNLYWEFELVAYGEDAHIFADYASRNSYTYDYALDEIRVEANQELNRPTNSLITKLIVLLTCLSIAIFILNKTFNTKKAMKELHTYYQPAEVPPFYTGIPSDLDPNFAAALVFSKGKAPKDDSGIYTALLLSLSRKGYVTIAEDGYNDALLTVKNPNAGLEESIMPAEPLNESEILYYNLLVRHSSGNPIRMSTLKIRIEEDYEYTSNFADNIKTAIKNAGVNGGYIQKADFTEPKDTLLRLAKTYIRFGIIILTLVNLIIFHTRLDFAFGGFTILGMALIASAIYLKTTAGNYVLLTQLGENEYAKWRGLYNYLKSDQLMSDSNVENMPVWERYFIYATAFGIPTKVTQALGFKFPEGYVPEGYYYDTGSILYNRHVRSVSFHINSGRIGGAVRSGVRFKKASSTSRGYTGGGRSWSSYGGGGS